MIRNILLAVVATSLLSACTVLPYAPPASNQYARLRITSPNLPYGGTVSAVGAQSASCSEKGMLLGELQNDVISNLVIEKPKVGMPGSEGQASNRFFERKIPVGQPYFLRMRGTAPMRICLITSSFAPVAGADYEAAFTVGERGCQLHISKLETDTYGRTIGVFERATQEAEACGSRH